MDEIISILEVVTRNKRSLLIISDMDDAVLNALNVNKAKGLIKVNVVKPEGIGIKRFELLQDLCVLTGAILASDETGNDLSTVDSSYLGQAIKCVSTEKDTVIITDREAFKEEIEDTIKSVNESIQKAENKMNLWHYKDRLSRLCGGVAVVYVGAETEVEMREKKDRVDDAIKAVKSALEEGVVAGGGICLYEIQEEINKNVDLYIENPTHFVDGYLCVLESLTAPMENILKNASVEFDYVANTIDEFGFGYGYDVVNEIFGNMFTIGVIDATKVTRNAVQNAVSVSATLLTTECTITNKRA
jgi:chaperonin GroEL